MQCLNRSCLSNAWTQPPGLARRSQGSTNGSSSQAVCGSPYRFKRAQLVGFLALAIFFLGSSLEHFEKFADHERKPKGLQTGVNHQTRRAGQRQFRRGFRRQLGVIAIAPLPQ